MAIVVGVCIQIIHRPTFAPTSFDKATNQPDCEQAEKVALLKAVAKAVGVELPI